MSSPWVQRAQRAELPVRVEWIGSQGEPSKMPRPKASRVVVNRKGEPIAWKCECGWTRTILTDETVEDARRAHEGTAIHKIEMGLPY